MKALPHRDGPAGTTAHGRRLCIAAAALMALTPTAARASEQSSLIAQVVPGSTVALRSAPGGSLVARLGSRTEFGSRRTLAVAARRGHWLGVLTPELGNGRLGWLDARERAVTYTRTPFRIEVDLSRRELVLHRGTRLKRRFTVSVGRSGSPTPTGRFAVTDKLPGARFSSVYGCCILALSGHQTRPPRGWRGGDRLAIHGSPGDIVGGAASAGCLHARTLDLRLLMRTVPVGAPVVIHL